jgi:DNA primase large subunit
MRRIHARYPFLSASREAVQEADVDLGALVAEGGPAIERGRERVERALLSGTAAGETRTSIGDELLSYPVARLLVSLLGSPGAVEKYANAEAMLAHARFTEDFDDDAQLRSTDRERLSLEQLLADLELADRVTPTGDGGFSIEVTSYLKHAATLEGDRWRLVARNLSDGAVPIVRTELFTLLREAIRRRVARELPLTVPDQVASALTDEIATLRNAVADVDLSGVPRVVARGQFPPCITSLLERAPALDTDGQFTLTAFLAGLDIEREQLESMVEPGSEGAIAQLHYQFDRLADTRGAVFPPPSCATMEQIGLCVNKDNRCETIDHPVSYYGSAVDEAGLGGESTR